MAAIAFDTLQFARRLIAAGVPEKQAETQAELMAEAFVHNIDSLATKDYIDASLDARLIAQEARLERKLAKLDSRVDHKFTALETSINQRFSGIDLQLVTINGNFR